MSLRSGKIGRPTCVLHNLPTKSTVQCNTQMQAHCLFLKNTANDSMVDLMACRGANISRLLSIQCHLQLASQTKIKGVVVNSHCMDLQHLIHSVYSANFSLSVILFQTMLDNSPLDSGSRETLPFGAFTNM